MPNLAQLIQEIKDRYAGLPSYIVPSEKIGLTESGYLTTGTNEFPLTLEGLDQFAQRADIPTPFFRTLEPDHRSIIFNRRFRAKIADGTVERDIRVNLNRNNQIIGFDDPKLLRITPIKLVEVIGSSLPTGLSAEQIEVAWSDFSPSRFHVSCFSPQIISEPRPGDIINGGVDIVHHLSGDCGTQFLCYLRRLVCRNGAAAHVCNENRQIRARRLHNGLFDEDDMLVQSHRVLVEVWAQVGSKLDAIKGLLEKKRVSFDFLRQQRTRFSLNNRVVRAIETAISEDEFGPTNTQYDIFNGISRVATHDENLSFRQRRTLSRMAGEFSQQTVNRCDKCGSWIIHQN